MPDAIKDYLKLYPDSVINIQQYHPHHPPNIYEFDIVIGMPSPASDETSQHHIQTFTHGYYAAPEYVQKHGQPNTIEELKNHIILNYDSTKSLKDTHDKKLESDSFFNLNEFVLQGMGISAICREEVQNNPRFSDLVSILPHIVTDNIEIKLKFLKKSAKKKIILELLDLLYQHVNRIWHF